jgi:hypothetical protein
MDRAGGLEPLLAYAYFSTKNYNASRIDPIAVDLANQHLENPLSQALFALTGPITADEIQRAQEEVIHKAPSRANAQKTSHPAPPAQSVAPKDLGKLIRERVKSAIAQKRDIELPEELMNIGELDISKIIDAAMKGEESAELEKLKEIGAAFDKKKKKSDQATKDSKNKNES